jgi:predicted nucleotidyltransferase
VVRLFVFGSILTDNFKKSVLLIYWLISLEFDLYNYADNYFDLKTSFEKLLKRQIDMLEDKAVKNPYLRKSIDSY